MNVTSDEDAEHAGAHEVTGAPRHHGAAHGGNRDEELHVVHRGPPFAHALLSR